MEKIFDIITIIISMFFLIKALKKIRVNFRSFMYIIFFIIYILPLFLDYIIGTPDYNTWYTGATYRGFIISYKDSTTRILYDIFLLLTQFVLMFYKEKNIDNKLQQSEIESYSLVKILLVIFSFLPIILVIIKPSSENRILYEFGWRENGNTYAQEIMESEFYFSFEKLSYIGLACSLINLIKSKKIKSKILFILLAYFNICIESKRSIIFLTLFFILYYLIDSKNIKLKKIFIISGCLATLVLTIGVFVKTERGYESSESIYATLRVDFFRDDRVKMAIYSMLHPEQIRILNYPGESYIMQIGYIYPLDYLKFERIGYNAYLTSALIGTSVESGINFMTTSMCDEVFANFGWFAFIINPILLVYISEFLNKRQKIIKYFGIIGVIMLFMYSLNYIMWYLEILIILIIANKIILKKKEYLNE